MTKKEDKKLDDCYQELFEKMVDLQMKYPKQMVAGTMMAQALRIYKSTLDDEGFKAMMETTTTAVAAATTTPAVTAANTQPTANQPINFYLDKDLVGKAVLDIVGAEVRRVRQQV